jgi:hypothetical protein
LPFHCSCSPALPARHALNGAEEDIGAIMISVGNAASYESFEHIGFPRPTSRVTLDATGRWRRHAALAKLLAPIAR